MKFRNVIISLGLAAVMGVGVAAGLSGQKERKAANASGEKSVTFITDEPTWDGVGYRGMHAWGEGNGTNLCGAWGDSQLGAMTLSDGFYRQTVNFTTSCDGAIFRFKQSGTYWQTVDLTTEGGFLDGKTYRISGISYKEDITGGKRANASIALYEEPVVYEPHTYTLVGNKLTNSWDPTDTSYDFQMSNGNKTATLTRDFVSGEEFKVCEDHGWTKSYGYEQATTVATELTFNGENFYVKTSGNYTITLTTNEHYFMSTLVVAKNSQLPYRQYSLVGTVNGEVEPWNAKATAKDLTPAQDGKSASITLDLAVNQEFKVVTDHDWDNPNYGFNLTHIDLSAQHCFANSGGNYKVLVAGNYTITVNLNNDYSFNNIVVANNAAYSVTIGSTPAALTAVNKGDHTAQWKATVSVQANQAISFTLDGDPLAVTADAESNNNVNRDTNKVLSTASNVDLYLKLDGENYSYWLAGREATYFVNVNGNTVAAMSENPAKAGEYMATSVVLAANDVVRFYNTDLFDANVVEGSTGTWTTNEGHIVCGTAGTYNIYMTPGTPNNVYFGAPSLADAEATAFAETFLGAFQKTGENPAGICAADGSTDTAALKAKWNGNDIAGAYDALGDEAKGILTNASTTGSAKVNDFARLYDYIYAKYQETAALGLSDFAGRFANPTNSMLRPLSTNSGIINVVVIISASLLLVSLAGFVVIRKKRLSK